jgi:hypothetical protein
MAAVEPIMSAIPRERNQQAWKDYSNDKTTDASSRPSRQMYDGKT